MEPASLVKRALGYLINVVIFVGFGFLFVGLMSIVFDIHIALVILFALLFALAVGIIFNIAIMFLSKGYTIGNAIFGIKYVSSDGQKINFKQTLIRSLAEATIIFILLDMFYLFKNRTERSVIDHLSDSFAIDVRL